MNFGTQFKQLRTEHHQTQEQAANALHVTRQAISNWETGRNMPDLDLVLRISELYDIPVDSLLKGESCRTNLSEKLIQDGDEKKTQKMRMITAITGAVLMAIGFLFFVLKGMTIEYIDSEGILHENFFLIPIGWLFIFTGLLVIFFGFIQPWLRKQRNRRLYRSESTSKPDTDGE